MTDQMQPTYYVRHPDDTYSVADPQPELRQRLRPRALCERCHGFGSVDDGIPCLACGGERLDPLQPAPPSSV